VPDQRLDDRRLRHDLQYGIWNGGNLYGTGSLDYGVSDSATITPGDSSTSTDKLQVNGTYTQNAQAARRCACQRAVHRRSSGRLHVSISGGTSIQTEA